MISSVDKNSSNVLSLETFFELIFKKDQNALGKCIENSPLAEEHREKVKMLVLKNKIFQLQNNFILTESNNKGINEADLINIIRKVSLNESIINEKEIKELY